MGALNSTKQRGLTGCLPAIKPAKAPATPGNTQHCLTQEYGGTRPMATSVILHDALSCRTHPRSHVVIMCPTGWKARLLIWFSCAPSTLARASD
jgi:hypothetical protein